MIPFPPAIIYHAYKPSTALDAARNRVRAAWKAVQAAETDTECEEAWNYYQTALREYRAIKQQSQPKVTK